MTDDDRRPDRPTRGQVLEHLLIVALIVLVSVAALAFFSTQVGEILSSIAREIHAQ